MSSLPGLGRLNSLEITDINAAGLRLDCSQIRLNADTDGVFDFAILPIKEANAGAKIGDQIEVFLHLDSQGQIIATTSRPTVQVGQCAFLKVVSTSPFGAFLDWGLAKDLLLPNSEQAYPVRVGKSYVVYAYLDESTGRVACTTQLHHYLEEESNHWMKKGQAVELLIAAKSDLGFKAVVDGTHIGLIFHNELSQPLQFGEKMKGWIKNIREDGRLDLSINTLDSESRDVLSADILARLKESGGRLELSDKSSSEEIFQIFRVSKKNFKRAISGLYKQRLIKIEPTYIELI
jgi:uncharacterized protein